MKKTKGGITVVLLYSLVTIGIFLYLVFVAPSIYHYLINTKDRSHKNASDQRVAVIKKDLEKNKKSLEYLTKYSWKVMKIGSDSILMSFFSS